MKCLSSWSQFALHYPVRGYVACIEQDTVQLREDNLSSVLAEDTSPLGMKAVQSPSWSEDEQVALGATGSGKAAAGGLISRGSTSCQFSQSHPSGCRGGSFTRWLVAFQCGVPLQRLKTQSGDTPRRSVISSGPRRSSRAFVLFEADALSVVRQVEIDSSQ